MSAIELGKEKRRATFQKKKRANIKKMLKEIEVAKAFINKQVVEIVERGTYLPIYIGANLFDWCEEKNVTVTSILEEQEGSSFMLIYSSAVYGRVYKIRDLEKRCKN